MLLKNLMEDKQLNFDQPLLSTRRYPSTVSNSESENRRKRRTDNAHSKVPPLPKYKSELKSGPVRNPGTVPFVWEQMPGRPKYESKPQTNDRECHAITVPKLPPGRILNIKHETPDGVFEGTAVNHSQGKIGLANSQDVKSLDKIITEEVCKEVEPGEIGRSDLGDNNSVYVDAVDTLSRCESFFMTCSISGVSGLDGGDFKIPETYQTDPQARDFMIGRFLPAAKAMASEMPQHSDRRHPVPKEQQTEKTVTVAKRRPPNLCRPSNLPYYTESETVEDSDDDDYDAADSTSHNLCGLLPRLCLQSSFCLLNPVPGIRKQAELPIKSVRTRNLKSANVSSRETQSKCEKETPFEKRFSYGPQASGKREDKNQLQHGPKQVAAKIDHKRLELSSPFRDIQNKGVDAYHKERTTNKETGFLGIPERAQIAKGNYRMEKDGSNLQELLLNESNEWAASSPMVERTLYIDSVQTLRPKSLNSGSSDTSTPDYSSNEVQMLPESPKVEVTVPVDFVASDGTKNNSAPEKSEVRPESIKSPDYHSLSSSHRSVNDVQLDVTDDSAHCKDVEKDSFKSPHHKVDEAGKTGLESQVDARWGNSESILDIKQSAVSVASSKFLDNEMTYVDSQFHVRPIDRNSYDSSKILRPIPPPLPKSPSESWLKRALPAVASRSSSKPTFAASIDPPKTHNFDPKWETIVRTSNVQHGHLRFSEELLAPIPEA